MLKIVFLQLVIQELKVSKETKKIYKDVFVVSFSFLLLFLAFNSTFRLQSSIHTEANIGLWSKVFFILAYSIASKVYFKLLLFICLALGQFEHSEL